jgi:endogenous inhibitor of DNA gyrase (YacG/DUF329 family)
MARGAKKTPTATGDVVPLRPAQKCPICRRPSTRDYYPFDSKRCMDIDLAKWLSGSYAIPAVEAEGEAEDESRDGES